mgnify:CR=1 FL=1
MDIQFLMRKHGIKPDKRLGQHFLVNEAPIFSMIKAAELTLQDEVLEVGPGLGVLTVNLCDKVKKVVAVEKDKNLIPIVADLTKDLKNICLLQEDVLKLNMEKLKREYFSGNFKVVANLPYYITSRMIMKIIRNRHMIENAVLMVQKEVAQRIVAPPGKKDYGILSIAVQLFADTHIVCDVDRTSFLPPPRVDSSVVKISLEKNPDKLPEDEELFFKVVEAAFSQRRKTIRNSLKNCLRLPKVTEDVLDKALYQTDIDPMRRGETLSIEEYILLAQNIKHNIERQN